MPSLELLSCTVDLDQHLVLGRHGGRTTLTPIESRLLRYLSERAGTTVSRAVLLREVWEYKTFETRTLETTIMRLRRKIERDYRAPEHLQAVRGVGYRWVGHAPEMPREKAALAVAPVALVGRATELKVLSELMRAGRVVTLRGPGGVGKSALAQALVRSLRDTGHDVIWAESGASEHVEPTLAVLAKALGIADVSDERLAELVGRVLAARPPAVVVLDDVDRVVQTLGPLLAGWVGRAPHTAFLVSSRVALGIESEHVVDVLGLPPEEGARLLADRARQAGASGAFDERGLQALSRILDGIPLLLQLVARQLAALPLAAVIDRLRQGTEDLRARKTGGRHDSALACVEWSWESLDAEERRVLRAVAWFEDGFALDTVEAALGTAGREQVLRLLEQSLLTRLEPTGRFRLFHYVRDFVVREPLPEEVELVLIEAAITQAERISDVSLSGAEVHNLVAAHERARALGRPDLAVRAALVASEPVLLMQGALVAEPIARRAATELVAPPVARAKALMQWSRALRNLGRHDDARAAADESLRIASGLGDPALLARMATNAAISQDYATAAGLARARVLLDDASAALMVHEGDDARAAICDLNLALLLDYMGEVERSRQTFVRALERAERVAGPVPRGGVLFCFAGANVEWGELDEGKTRARRAIAVLEGTGRRLALLRARSVLARAHAVDASVPSERAAALMDVVAQALEELGAREYVARARVDQAGLALADGRIEAAREFLVEGEDALGPVEAPDVRFDLVFGKAMADLLEGDPRRTIERIGRVVDVNSPSQRIEARALLALAHRTLGDTDAAAQALADVSLPGFPLKARDLLLLAQGELATPSRWRIVQALALHLPAVVIR